MENTGMTFTAMVRSFVQYAVGAMLAAQPVVMGLNWLTEKVGFSVDTGAVRAWLEAFIFALIVGALVKLGQRFPLLNQLMSLGRSASSPVYVPAGDTTVAATVEPEGTTVFTEEGTGVPAPTTYEEKP